MTTYKEYKLDGGELSYNSWRKRNKELRIEKETDINVGDGEHNVFAKIPECTMDLKCKCDDCEREHFVGL